MTMKMDADANLEHAADDGDIDIDIDDVECDDDAAAVEDDSLVTLTGLQGSCSAASVPPQPQPRSQL